MRILVAGAGLFGRTHMELLLGQGVVIAAADPMVALADRARADFGAETGLDAIALMDTFRPDGVIIAASAAAHLPLAAAALARGIPVLVEKPVALTSSEAAQIGRFAAASGTFALPGHVLRFSAQHMALANAVHRSTIGRVLSVTSRRCRDAGHALRYADIDPVLMTMIHDIDLAQWMTGNRAVSARADRVKGRDGRSVTHATLRDSGGVLWQLVSAWTYPGVDAPPDRIEVLGEDGSLELVVGSGLTSSAAGRIFHSDPTEDALLAEQTAFLAAISTGIAPPEVTMDDAIAGLKAVEMVLADLGLVGSGSA